MARGERVVKTQIYTARRGTGWASYWFQVPSFIRVFIALDILLVAAHVTGKLLNRLDFRLTIFNLDFERSVPTWYSSMQLFLIGMLLAAFAASDASRGRRFWIAAGSLLFLFLSIDESVGIHDMLRDHLFELAGPAERTFFRHTSAWPLFLGPPLVLAMLIVGRGAAGLLRVQPRVRRLYIVGLMLFVTGAVCLESLLNLFPLWGWTHRIEIILEEFLEMLGATCFLWATLELLSAHGVQLLSTGSPRPGLDVPDHSVLELPPQAALSRQSASRLR